MKAVRFHGSRDIRWEDIAAPSGLRPEEVMVRPSLCGICGTDVHEYLDGPHWTPKTKNPFSGAQLPQILGHEFAGEIVAVGGAVTSLRPGDRVSIQPQVGPFSDYFGSRRLFQYSPASAVIGLSWPWGGMSELAVVNEYNAIRLPDSVTDAQGAMVEPAAVAVQSVDRGGVRTGDTVLVTGGGPIGVLVAMAADAAGAARVVMSETSPGRRARLENLGVASLLLDPRSEGFRQMVRDTTIEGVGVDVAIECSGSAVALEQCLDLVRPLGSVVVTGVIHGGAKVDPFQWLLKGLTIQASLAYPTDIWPRVLAMIASGKLPVEKLVDKTIGGSDVVGEGILPLLDPASTLLKVLVQTR
ncbi:zinc-binding dehydrogenase [Mesorhizobium sp. CGMCC 1.15528]|uniref:Zinc-binding dehydrogenase n=1 Tax=Mesorhizobium zhangyense TaxID=1776730 RepID=A0A7C9RB45_9HYPH|nr:zinc-binding dehydrogenase [Mesorhizobium zhangyense]NGN44654.1 zinc-binding dehydrogenase [Mesorhizobium zhangyense]